MKENELKVINHYKNILKVGDRVGVIQCLGIKKTITFAGWAGIWMISKSGGNDYSPLSIYKLNGEMI